jgi:hypothetical protein
LKLKSNLFKSNLFWNLFKPFDFSEWYPFKYSYKFLYLNLFFKQNLILYFINRAKSSRP